MNHHPSRDLPGYYAALADEQAAFDDALQCIRAELAEGKITREQAAAERAGLIQASHERIGRLRAEHGLGAEG